MVIDFLTKGVAIGFAMAAPIGPIGVLCIRRTIAGGRAQGLATGLGAASADAVYGAMAASVLTLISDALLGHQAWLQGAGGLFLIVFGVRTFNAIPAAPIPGKTANRPSAYLSALSLTLTQPVTILSFAAVFAALGLGRNVGATADAIALVSGVFAGSAAWWLLLTTAVHRYLRRSPGIQAIGRAPLGATVVTGFGLSAAADYLRKVNRVSGLILLGFGLAAWAGLAITAR